MLGREFQKCLLIFQICKYTDMDECLQSFGYFHTKMAFSRGHLEPNWFCNFLILLRVKQYIEGEHKLKFWLFTHFKTAASHLSWKLLLLSKCTKYRSFFLNTPAVLKFVNIFYPKLQFMFPIYMLCYVMCQGMRSLIYT